MSGISTHILDTSRGQPAAGVEVVLEFGDPVAGWREISRGTTNADGRVGALLPTDAQVQAGDYRLRFATGNYFRTLGQAAFYPEVVIHVRIDAPGGKYHLPLLLNPFGYSTYRGS